MAKYEPITITPEEVAKLEDLHERIFVLKGPERCPWLAVFRSPNADEARAFVAMANDKAKAEYANVRLLTQLCVYPKGGKEHEQSSEWKRQYSAFPLFLFDAWSHNGLQEFLGLAGAKEAYEK